MARAAATAVEKAVARRRPTAVVMAVVGGGEGVAKKETVAVKAMEKAAETEAVVTVAAKAAGWRGWQRGWRRAAAGGGEGGGGGGDGGGDGGGEGGGDGGGGGVEGGGQGGVAKVKRGDGDGGQWRAALGSEVRSGQTGGRRPPAGLRIERSRPAGQSESCFARTIERVAGVRGVRCTLRMGAPAGG